MAKKNSRRHQQKQKERERRNRKHRKVLAERRRFRELDRHLRRVAPLPDLQIDTSEATNNDITNLVEAGIEGFSKIYTRTMSEDALALMADQRALGWTRVVNDQAAEIQDMTREQVSTAMKQLVEIELGDGILRSAPDNLIRRTLPMSCFTLDPDDRGWKVRCRSLRSVKSSHGQLYQSPHQPTISLRKKDREVLFTRHALLQLADRIIPYWRKHYIGQVYVFGFFYECVFFGKTRLLNGQRAFVVYNSCVRVGKNMRAFWRKLIGVETDKDLRDYYYVVGYCPVTIDGNIAVARTFLTPGYRQTPERALIKEHPNPERVRDLEQACDEGINTMTIATSEHARKAVKFFHKSGVHQYMKMGREVFRDMGGPYAWIMHQVDKEEEEFRLEF